MLKEEKELRKHLEECNELMFAGAIKKCCRQHITALVRAVREDAIKEVYNFCQHTELPDENDNCRECEEIAAAIRAKK